MSMGLDDKIQLFEDKRIRTAWDEEKEEWYFSIQDVVEALTDSADVKQYIKKMKSRDPELNLNWGTICTLVTMTAADGKSRRVHATDTKGMLRIIQSISSPKAEPFKQLDCCLFISHTIILSSFSSSPPRAGLLFPPKPKEPLPPLLSPVQLFVDLLSLLDDMPQLLL